MFHLKIIYHYIRSVTVSSSNRYPICAGCLLSRHVLVHLDTGKWDQLVISETSEWNYQFIPRTIPEDNRSPNMFNFIVSFHQENAKWQNINVFCVIISENTVTRTPRSRGWSCSLYSTFL